MRTAHVLPDGLRRVEQDVGVEVAPRQLGGERARAGLAADSRASSWRGWIVPYLRWGESRLVRSRSGRFAVLGVAVDVAVEEGVGRAWAAASPAVGQPAGGLGRRRGRALTVPAPLSARRATSPPGRRHGWLHVDDHCRGIALVLTGGRAGEIYNIGGGTELTNKELTQLLLDATGKDWSYVDRVEDRLGHDLRYSVDIAKISAELGYAPQVPFEQGLAEVVQWYRDNRAWWEPLKERRRHL